LARLWAVVAALLLVPVPFVGWETTIRGGPNTAHFGWAAATYFPGMVSWFAILDFGHSRIKWHALATLWGIVAMTPWSIAIALPINRGYDDWRTMHTVLAAALAILFGSVMGATLFQSPAPTTVPPPTRS
jgi:hypothetical protein